MFRFVKGGGAAVGLWWGAAPCGGEGAGRRRGWGGGGAGARAQEGAVRKGEARAAPCGGEEGGATPGLGWGWERHRSCGREGRTAAPCGREGEGQHRSWVGAARWAGQPPRRP
ncbi:hypothetical protein ABZP36_029538 [Zizania latifolia]